MSLKSFDEFVNQQAALEKQEPFDKERELAQWRQYLSEFYKTIECFLDKYIAEKKVKLEYNKQAMHEDFIGPYEVDALTVLIGAHQIHFKPIGTMLIGAKGRIDMTGPRGTVRFVLVDRNASAPKIGVRVWIKGQEPPPEQPAVRVVEWTWKISTPPPKIKYTELEEEPFYTAMMEVVNG